jgi:hypothetical protein
MFAQRIEKVLPVHSTMKKRTFEWTDKNMSSGKLELTTCGHQMAKNCRISSA